MAKTDLICWPDWMPKPQRSGYSYSPVDRRKKTDMEVGSISRVEFDADETTCDCSLILDRKQASWFESFERGVLRQGSRWFRMPLQFGGCIAMQTVRFSTRPKASELIGLHTTYTFTLEIECRELPLKNDFLAEIMLCLSFEELYEMTQNSANLAGKLQGWQVPPVWLPKKCGKVVDIYEL